MAYTEIGGSPFMSNSGYMTTHMHVYWESQSATMIRIKIECTLGGTTSLGTGNPRALQGWIYSAAGALLGSGSIEIKSTYETWTQPNTYTKYLDVSIPYQSGGTLLLTANVVPTGGSINSCRWDATPNTNYPSQQSLSWPVYNTAPYWPASATVSVSPNGIIPENTTSLAVSWTPASDDQGDTRYYDVYRISSLGTSLIANHTTATSLNDSIGAGNFGAWYRYEVYVTDGSLWASGSILSDTVTKNTFSTAALNHTGDIAFATATIPMSHTTPSNTNGNMSFTYDLMCNLVPVYNPMVDLASVGNVLTIWRSGGYPSGPYIKFSELKAALASASFHGTLIFMLGTNNAYGSTGTDTEAVAVDLRTVPTGLAIGAVTGAITFGGNNYYLPDQQAITLNWAAATDPLGTAITYDVLYKLSSASTWTVARSGLTGLTTTITPPSADTALTYNVKVRAVSAYGYTAEASYANLVINKYLRPIIKVMSKTRSTTQVVLEITLEMRSSLSTLLHFTQLKYTNKVGTEVTVFSTATQDGTWTITYTDLTQTDSYTMQLYLQDDMGTTLGAARVNLAAAITRYLPMFSVRRKGVGVNCIPDGSAEFMVNGKAQVSGDFRFDGQLRNGGTRVYINLFGQIQVTDHRRSVIALCVLDNTDTSLISYSMGTIYLRRSNGLLGSIQIDVCVEKAYNSTQPNIHLERAGLLSGYIQPCTFTYNGVKFGGLEIYISDANYETCVFEGVSNMDIFGLDYYSTSSGVLNAETYNSLYIVPSANLQSGKMFLTTPQVFNDPIISMGENGYGRFEKMSDGILICTGVAFVPANTLNASINLPSSFAVNDYRISFSNQYVYLGALIWATSNKYANSFVAFAFNHDGNTPTYDAYADYIAIGKWK